MPRHVTAPNRTDRPGHARLGVLVILSLALHAALLLPAWTARVPPCCTAPRAVARLDVQLLGTTVRVTSPSVPGAPTALPYPTTTHTPASESPPAETVSAAPPDAPRPDASGDAQAGTNQRLAQRRLISELARYFSYPTLARRHGWEGQVLLSLTIEADGHLQNLRLAHSSGHAVLDSAALQALHRVARLANAHEWLGGSAVDVRLPVIYRLQE